MSCKAHLDMEIRKLRPGELYTLGSILIISDAWKKLMSSVPKQGNAPKFNSDHIKIIEEAARTDKRNAAQIFLDEWSTMGKERPTLKLLLELLINAELFRAADYVACDILKREKPKRPDHGPAAPIDISDTAINKLSDKQMLPQNTIINSILGLGSTSELISDVRILPSEKPVLEAPVIYGSEELSSEELPVFLNTHK
ncbi:protein Tube [Solenopsis invicta]|uniref:protein Tube n=1 Tax=Solenopsis invicta TaxID=13686 RepID=UPI0001FEC038|nr:protein Tube [Solenopsis invicta]XP_025985972.1 protein Tube [Solenopsis invicta]